MSSEHVLDKVSNQINRIIPANAGVTAIEFEGPEVAIYSKNISVLIDSEGLLSQIARTIRKRVVIRSDPAVRLPIDKVLEKLKKILHDKVIIGDIEFDKNMGEVIIYVDKPNKLTRKQDDMINTITKETLWRPKFFRIPPIKSNVIKSVRNVLFSDSAARKEALLRIGKMVHRETLLEEPIIRITSLGGYLEVGRTATLVQTGDANILVDCGVSVGSSQASKMLPRFDLPEFELLNLDAVVISHSHLDHCGFLPFLFKYGYEGPVFVTDPTLNLMTMLQIDYLDIAEKEGKLVPYSKNDIRKSTLHAITIKYGEVTDIAPGVKLTFHNAGHILGSGIVHLHIGNGKHNLAFAHDFKFANSRLLDRAVHKFPRLETIVMEATYGNPQDMTPKRQDSEDQIAMLIKKALARKGKVLIPVLAVGRAQELQLVIEHLIRTKQIPEVPVYVDGMVKEATAITTNHPEFLSRQLRELIFEKNHNPFLASFWHEISVKEEREQLLEGEPCIIMATSGMLVGGPSVYYFNKLAEDEKNMIIFVSYQGKGTLGRKVEEGTESIIVKNEQNKSVELVVNMEVHRISGFTGHSDRGELMEFAKRLSPRPKKFLIMHGEMSKCETLAKSIGKSVKRESLAPPIGTTTRLY
ncbi:MAG: Ribonuclease [Candidatus Heimdallarchaeota archaeon LC_2]|nr:MAG: Ribonuclease [Candidatus Heimdallarchaeota archaeon LC_2]